MLLFKITIINRIYNFRHKLKYSRLFLIPLLLALVSGCATNQPPGENPNVILILTDDQGYGDLHVHGNDSIYTPTIDRLASEGMRLNNFYVSPVCAPTRASLLTGRYHLRTGVTWVTRNAEMMNPAELTLAEILRSQGYRTGCFGKWHNGAHYPSDPVGQGFEVFTGFMAGHLTNYFDPVLEDRGTRKQFSGYITDIITDEALKFIENNAEKPFFCYVPYNAPHSPFEVPDKYFDPYREKGMSERLASVYGMVQNIDENIARILHKVEELDLTRETIILFITDNGPQFARYNDGMKGRKGWVNDGGVRVPCFIQWDGVIAPGTSDQLSAHIDVLPTLLGLTGNSHLIPSNIDGQDLSGYLLGGETLPERALYTHFRYRNGEIPRYPGAVRNDSLRLVIDQEGRHTLTRLLTDRAENTTLNSQYPEIAIAMRADYDQWIAGVMPARGIPPLPVGYPEVDEVYLASHESKLSGDLTYKFSPNGWAHDWIIDWDTPGERITWDLEVNATTPYEVLVQYTCPPENTGSEILLTTGTDTLRFTISEAFEPVIIPNQDRWPRDQEAYEQTWGWQKAGTVTLTRGMDHITMDPALVPGTFAGEIKGIKLLRQSPE